MLVVDATARLVEETKEVAREAGRRLEQTIADERENSELGLTMLLPKGPEETKASTQKGNSQEAQRPTHHDGSQSQSLRLDRLEKMLEQLLLANGLASSLTEPPTSKDAAMSPVVPSVQANTGASTKPSDFSAKQPPMAAPAESTGLPDNTATGGGTTPLTVAAVTPPAEFFPAAPPSPRPGTAAGMDDNEGGGLVNVDDDPIEKTSPRRSKKHRCSEATSMEVAESGSNSEQSFGPTKASSRASSQPYSKAAEKAQAALAAVAARKSGSAAPSEAGADN